MAAVMIQDAPVMPSPAGALPKTQEGTDERLLVKQAQKGDLAAFDELVTRFQERIYATIYHMTANHEDANDLAQESFIKAYQALNSFKGDSSFFTWLYRIAFNSAISLKRRKRATVSLDAGGPDGGIDPYDPSEYVKPGQALERMEGEVQLQEAMNRLSSEHREVLVLKDIEGMKYEEIAAILDVPIGTIRSRLHRARLELRDLLPPED